jgi:NAD(P)H-dependent FMN reductase
MIGRTIHHYQILEKLGEGGMGAVYKAADQQLDRIVALKFISLHLCEDAPALQRFQREARAAASLHHPNICSVYEFGCVPSQGWEGAEYEGHPFIVMEYLEGETLAQQLRRKRLDRMQVIEYSTQIADALRAAHACGYLHRDLKPSNVFVTRHGQVKLLDFGLAKSIPEQSSSDEAPPTTLTASGSVVGTVDYMSPEQMTGKPLDERSDLFSFGVVLYEMATGFLPFPGDSDAATREAVLHGVPDPLTRHNPSAGMELEQITGRLLARAPENRFQTAGEVLNDLQRLKGAHPKQAAVVRVVGISGSLRERSYTRRAVEIALHGANRSGAHTQLIDLRKYRLPFCDGREEETSYPGDVASLRETVQQAQGLILGTPEYHGSFSGVLKNVVDLMGFDELEGKMIGLVGVAGGAMGALGALTALRSVGRAVHAWVIPDQASIPEAWKAFDDKMNLQDPVLQEKLEAVGRQVSQFAQLHTSAGAGEFLRLWQDSLVNPGG